MDRILDQNFFNNMLKGEREYFYHSKAFYNNDSLAAKVSKIVFPIFIVCFLALSIRDGIDIALSKKHYQKISLTNFIKSKSNQFISKYGATIVRVGALAALGYIAYRSLPNQVIESEVSHDTFSDIDPKMPFALGASIVLAFSAIYFPSLRTAKHILVEPPVVVEAPAVVVQPQPQPQPLEDQPESQLAQLVVNSEAPAPMGPPQANSINFDGVVNEEHFSIGPPLASRVLNSGEHSPNPMEPSQVSRVDNGVSFEGAEMLNQQFKFEDKHRIVMERLKNYAADLGLFNFFKKKSKIARRIFDDEFSNKLKDFESNFEDQTINKFTQHQNFILILRELLAFPKDNLNDDETHMMGFLNELAYFRFTDSALNAYLKGLFSNLAELETMKITNLSELEKKLKETNKIIHKNRGINLPVELQKLLGTINWFFDPQANHNIPYPRSSFSTVSEKGEILVTHLRLSTPTKSDGYTNSLAIEEFQAFLSQAKKQGQRIGYFNLQDQSSAVGDGERVQAIKSMQKPHENFFVWSLPFDGPIFALEKKVITDRSQSDLTEFATISDEDYKAILVNEFFREVSSKSTKVSTTEQQGDGQLLESEPVMVSKSEPQNENSLKPELQKLIDMEPIRFALPEHILENEKPLLKKELKSLLDDVHSFYFPIENNLSSSIENNNVAKRRTMTLLFYAHLVDFMTAKYNLNFVVTACKDNKDRGGAMNAACEIVRMIKTNKLNDPEILKNLFVHVLGAGLHTKNEHILENRLKFLTDLTEHGASLSNDEINAIRERFNPSGSFGEVTSFSYMVDSIIPANPFTVDSMEKFNEVLEIHLKQAYDNQIIHKGRLDVNEFTKILQSYTKEGRLNPSEIYRVFNKDFRRGFAPDKGGISLKTSASKENYVSYVNNKVELLKALKLPQSPEDINLERDDISLKFLTFLCQSSGGIGSTLFYKNQKLMDALKELKISIKPGDYLSYVGDFIPEQGTRKLKLTNSYHFYKVEEDKELAKIFFETEFDIASKKINCKWWVVENDSEFKPPLESATAALPARPLNGQNSASSRLVGRKRPQTKLAAPPAEYHPHNGTT